MSPKTYKCCLVPQCSNTTIKTPEKLFVHVPLDVKMRMKWFKLARRDPINLSTKSTLYFCEDHFDLPNDMENYIRYHVMGSVSQVRMKPGCVPTRFECQSERRKGSKSATNESGPKNDQSSEECSKDESNLTSTVEATEGNSNMSATSSACRVCLAVDVRLVSIRGLLQLVYEKLTNTELHTTDERPVTACYVCYAQLNKCRKLMLTCARAEKVLNGILSDNTKITLNSISQVDRDANALCWPLTSSKPECYDSLPATVQIKKEIESADDTEHVSFLDNEMDDVKTEIEDVVIISELETGDNKSILEGEDKDAGVEPKIANVDVKIEEVDDDAGAQITEVEGGIEVERIIANDGSSHKLEAKINTTKFEPDKSILAAVGSQTNVFPAITDQANKGEDAENIVTDRQLISPRKPPKNQNKNKKETPTEIKITTKKQISDDEKPKTIENIQSTEDKASVKEQTSIENQDSIEKQETESGYGPYQCNVCHRRFNRRTNLNRHAKIHTGEKPFSCTLCPNKFSRKYNLLNHLRIHRGEKPYECEECHRCFRRAHELVIHSRMHTGEKPYKCNMCPYRSLTNGELKKHLHGHTGEKPHECQICYKKFKRHADMMRHFKAHSGEKPFGCDLCPRRFSRKQTVISHLRIHAGEKPYHCNKCDYRSATQSVLRKHKQTHTGEKPFECDMCQQKFSRKQHVMYHLRMHVGDKPFECDICQYRSVSKNVLRRHIRRHANVT